MAMKLSVKIETDTETPCKRIEMKHILGISNAFIPYLLTALADSKSHIFTFSDQERKNTI